MQEDRLDICFIDIDHRHSGLANIKNIRDGILRKGDSRKYTWDPAPSMRDKEVGTNEANSTSRTTCAGKTGTATGLFPTSGLRKSELDRDKNPKLSPPITHLFSWVLTNVIGHQIPHSHSSIIDHRSYPPLYFLFGVNHGLDARFSVESIYYINTSVPVRYMIVGWDSMTVSMLFRLCQHLFSPGHLESDRCVVVEHWIFM